MKFIAGIVVGGLVALGAGAIEMQQQPHIVSQVQAAEQRPQSRFLITEDAGSGFLIMEDTRIPGVVCYRMTGFADAGIFSCVYIQQFDGL